MPTPSEGTRMPVVDAAEKAAATPLGADLDLQAFASLLPDNSPPVDALTMSQMGKHTPLRAEPDLARDLGLDLSKPRSRADRLLDLGAELDLSAFDRFSLRDSTTGELRQSIVRGRVHARPIV